VYAYLHPQALPALALHYIGKEVEGNDGLGRENVEAVEN
jgi:hypothetical protein